MKFTLKESWRNPTHRRDLDGLRAVSIIAVVIGHYSSNLLPGGYLGVDVFFVISGYVITLQLTRMKETQFSKFLLKFYGARIRRLLPALLLVVFATWTLSVLLLSRQEAVLNTGAYSLIGSSNLYLWHLASDYFGTTANQNPFTHSWSLGVEEQFYVIFPILFYFVIGKSRNRFTRLLLYLTILSSTSAALFILLSNYDSNFAYYGMPTRFWEIGFGASAAIFSLKQREQKHRSRFIVYLLLILLFAFFGFEIATGILPHFITTLITVTILLVSEKSDGKTVLNSQYLNWIGNRSYSLYLIHWPMLVFSKYIFGERNLVKIVGIILSVLLSQLLFKFIEQPFRRGRLVKSDSRTVVTGLLVLILSFGVIHTTAKEFTSGYNNTIPKFLGIQAVPEWNQARCSGATNISLITNPLSSCLGGSRKSEGNFVFLVGDSHADHLLEMVKTGFKSTKFVVRNINLEGGTDFPFAEFNSQSNSPSLKYLESNMKAGDVVILSFHRGHLNLDRDVHLPLNKQAKINQKTTNLIFNLTKYSETLNDLGVRLILVRDTPLMATVQTTESCALQKRILGSDGCQISEEQDRHTRWLQDYAFDNVQEANSKVLSWDPLDTIYARKTTFDVLDQNGKYVMYDWNHITELMSSRLGLNFKRWLASKGIVHESSN